MIPLISNRYTEDSCTNTDAVYRLACNRVESLDAAYQAAGVSESDVLTVSSCTDLSPSPSGALQCVNDSTCSNGYFCSTFCRHERCGQFGEFPLGTTGPFCAKCIQCNSPSCTERCQGQVPSEYGVSPIELAVNDKVTATINPNAKETVTWSLPASWEQRQLPSYDDVVLLPMQGTLTLFGTLQSMT